jgi:hypothetical protein
VFYGNGYNPYPQPVSYGNGYSPSYGNGYSPSYGNGYSPSYGNGYNNPSQPVSYGYGAYQQQEAAVEIACDTGGEYVRRSPTLPIVFELIGAATCPGNEQVLDSFWMSTSDLVEMVQPSEPAIAAVLEFGQFEVCQVVDCHDPIAGKSISKTCCTTVNTVNGI